MSKKKSFQDFEEIEQELDQKLNEQVNDNSKPFLIAKKDFEISHNGYHRVIKAGQDISDVPALYYENLKTEQVI